MTSFEYVITDPVGIHARPAGILAKEVKGMDSTVTIQKKGADKSADVTKLMKVMGLNIKQGDTVIVTVEGGDEAANAATIETFLKENM